MCNQGVSRGLGGSWCSISVVLKRNCCDGNLGAAYLEAVRWGFSVALVLNDVIRDKPIDLSEFGKEVIEIGSPLGVSLFSREARVQRC